VEVTEAGDLTITNTQTGRRVSSLWLVPVVPIVLVGCLFIAVASLDQAFIRDVLALR
jgi:hypothetical protein